MVVARVDAEHAIHAADRATHGATDNPADWASGGVAFRRAALHSAKNTLSMNSGGSGEQSHNHGYSKFLPHHHFSMLDPSGPLTPSLPVSSAGGQGREFPFHVPLEALPLPYDGCKAQ